MNLIGQITRSRELVPGIQGTFIYREPFGGLGKMVPIITLTLTLVKESHTDNVMFVKQKLLTKVAEPGRNFYGCGICLFINIKLLFFPFQICMNVCICVIYAMVQQIYTLF